MGYNTFFGQGVDPFKHMSWANILPDISIMGVVAKTIHNAVTGYDEKKLYFIAPKSYDNVLIFWAKQKMSLVIAQQLNMLFPAYQRFLRQKELDFISQRRKALYEKIIEQADEVNKRYGEIKLENGSTVNAKDCYGSAENTKDALFLSYVGDDNITYKEEEYSTTASGTIIPTTSSITTKTVYFYDLVPKITAKSSKNLICTKVQGRDYSRKELVGGGDIVFTVSGEINSNLQDVYPSNKVKRFIQIMQYGGIIDVNNLIFGQFNVKHVVIQDYTLSPPQYKNIQPYSFTCVAVEPEESVKVSLDTIQSINYNLANYEGSTWHDIVLGNKLDKWKWAGDLANIGLQNLAGGLAALGSYGFGELLDLVDNSNINTGTETGTKAGSATGTATGTETGTAIK